MRIRYVHLRRARGLENISTFIPDSCHSRNALLDWEFGKGSTFKTWRNAFINTLENDFY